MGYTTYVTGEFAITPPLTWNEFKDSPFAPHNAKSRYEPSLILRVNEDSVDTDEGPLLRRTATALVMRQIDEYRERGLVALMGRTPAEWIEDKPGSLGEQYRCMYFRDKEDGDGGDPEPKPVPDPPGQLTIAPREPYEAARMLTDWPSLVAEVRS